MVELTNVSLQRCSAANGTRSNCDFLYNRSASQLLPVLVDNVHKLFTPVRDLVLVSTDQRVLNQVIQRM